MDLEEAFDRLAGVGLVAIQQVVRELTVENVEVDEGFIHEPAQGARRAEAELLSAPPRGPVFDPFKGEVELQGHRKRLVVELEPDPEHAAVAVGIPLAEPSYVRGLSPTFEASRERRPKQFERRRLSCAVRHLNQGNVEGMVAAFEEVDFVIGTAETFGFPSQDA